MFLRNIDMKTHATEFQKNESGSPMARLLIQKNCEIG